MIIGKIAQAVLKLVLPQVAELLVPVKKYCFEDNENNIKLRELEQTVTDQGFRITTQTDMIKVRDEKIDNIVHINLGNGINPQSIDNEE